MAIMSTRWLGLNLLVLGLALILKCQGMPLFMASSQYDINTGNISYTSNNTGTIITGGVIWGHLMKECDALFQYHKCDRNMDFRVEECPAEPPYFLPPPKPTHPEPQPTPPPPPTAKTPWVYTVVIEGAVVMVLVFKVLTVLIVYERRKSRSEEGDQEGLEEDEGDENDTDGQAQPWEDDQPCASQQELQQEEQEQPETEARGPVHNTLDDDRNRVWRPASPDEEEFDRRAHTYRYDVQSARPSEETGDETHAKVCAGTTFDHSDLTQSTGEEEEDGNGATHYKSLAGDEATQQAGTGNETIAKHGQQEAASVVKGGQQVATLANAQHSSERSVSQDVEAEMEEESDITEQD